MKILFEILKVVLPAVIAGLFTFFITKYTYNKNRPLEKLEIAYNRIYYPLYRIISDKSVSENIDEVMNKCKMYITKYDKYVELSTKRLFETLNNCSNATKKKSIYQNFKANIDNRQSYLRRRLGYLEPNFVQIYKFSPAGSKSLFRITIEVCFIYLIIILSSMTMNSFDILFNVFVIALIFLVVLLFGELFWCIFRSLYYKIRG